MTGKTRFLNFLSQTKKALFKNLKMLSLQAVVCFTKLVTQKSLNCFWLNMKTKIGRN
jgi:hypothetical protein